jgi:hypothetical protein
MDQVSSGAVTTEEAGANAAGAFRALTDRLVTARRTQAHADFGAVSAAIGGRQARTIGSLAKTRAELATIIDEYDVPGGGDATAALVNQVKRTLDSMPEQVTPDRIERLLEVYGKASKGKGAIWENLDTAQQRMLAGRVFGSLQRDLDDMANNPSVEGRAAEALRAARNNYRVNSQRLNQLEETAIGKLAGPDNADPWAIGARLITQSPSAIRSSLEVLREADPAVAAQVKRAMLAKSLEDAWIVNAARPGGPTQAGPLGGGVLSSRKLASGLHRQRDQLAAALDPGEMAALDTVYRYMQRLGDRAGMEGSQTTPLAWVLDMAKGALSAVTSPARLAGSVSAIVTPVKIARAMTDPAGRNALVTLTRTTLPQAKRRAAVVYLTALWAREPSLGTGAPEGAEEPGETDAQ